MSFQLSRPTGHSTPSTPNNSSWSLRGITFGVNELSSSLTVANSCGSIFTRRELSDLMSLIQKQYNIEIDVHPLWLQYITFSRSSTVLGEAMRRVAVPNLMDDVNIRSLPGIATFVVLCCRYTHDVEMTMGMLNMLLVGGLGTVLRFEGGSGPNLPYTMKPQLQKFIESCLQTDMDSTVSLEAKTWMAKLAHYGQVGKYGGDFEIVRPQESQQLMAELLGGRSTEEHMKESSRGLDISQATGKGKAESPNTEIREPWARVYNTLHLSSAYIALAARANGADVVVQCFVQDGSKFFPSKPALHRQNTVFLVRLWLVQPPENVRGILRYSDSVESRTWYDGQRTNLHGPDDRNITIYGGNQELLEWTARVFGLRCKLSGTEEPDALSQLWRMGVTFAQRLRWVVRPQPNKLYPLRLTIEGHDTKASLPQQAIALAKAYGTGEQRKLKPLSRNIASIVHEFYGLTDYGTDLAQDEPEVLSAMQFVVTSMSVTILRRLTHTTDDSLDQYAFNLQTLGRGKRGLQDLLPDACSEGVTPQHLVWSGATLWGGASRTSQGSQRMTDDVLGVVAPNCTIIMDFIRDPHSFIENGIEKMFISVWRGAVPMLPRDPQSNFVRTHNRINHNGTKVGGDFETSQIDNTDAKRVMKGKMLLTFEPYTEAPTLGVFCCWYSGSLVFECSPGSILSNVLSRSMDYLVPANTLDGYKKPEELVKLQPMDLLEIKNFIVRDEAFVIVSGLHDPAWVLFAAGCCPTTNTIIHRGPQDSLEENIQSLIDESKFAGAEVLLLMP